MIYLLQRGIVALITITQLAKKLQLNESTLSMRISKIPHFKSKHTKKLHGSRFIDKAGVKLITSGYKVAPHSRSGKSKNNFKVVTKIKALQHELALEQHHNSQIAAALSSSNQALARANASEKRLETLLNQQQQLQLDSNERHRRVKYIATKQSQPSQSQASQSHRHSFWRRLFGLN